MVGSYSYFLLNCTASNMVVCLERRGKIFYCVQLQPGEAARVRSKSAGRFAFAVCCRTDRVAPPHLGASFRNFWAEHKESAPPLTTTSFDPEPATALSAASIGPEPSALSAASIGREPTTALSRTTSVNREPAARTTASIDHESAALSAASIGRGPTAISSTTSVNREPTTARTTASIDNESAALSAAGIGREPTTALSRTTSVGREPTTALVNRSTASTNRGATPPPSRSMTTRSMDGSIVTELLAATISNKNVKKSNNNVKKSKADYNAADHRPPAAAPISPSSGNKQQSDHNTRRGEAKGRGAITTRSSFPGTREGEGGGKARRRRGGSKPSCSRVREGEPRGRGSSRPSCYGVREGDARGRGRGGSSSRSSSCSGRSGELAGSRSAVVPGSGAGVVEEPLDVLGRANHHHHLQHQPRHFKYRKPHFFALCDTFCAFSGGGSEAISLHDLNEKVFRSYEPIIRRGEM